VWTTLFAVAVVPLLISSVVAAVVTCFYFACVRKERGSNLTWMNAGSKTTFIDCLNWRCPQAENGDALSNAISCLVSIEDYHHGRRPTRLPQLRAKDETGRFSPR
jgi:hypothetical protein